MLSVNSAHVTHDTGSPGSSVFDLPTQTQNNPTSGLLSPPPEIQPAIYGTSEDGPSVLMISGGTGGNSICSAFRNACYVLPVSDDGGSSSEIIRVLGGPSVGDIRSRLVRLIPPTPTPSPLDAIRRLLAHRLPAQLTEREARDEWRDVVEGRSKLWMGIPNDRKETIRGFLVYFESELLKRAHKNFDFRNGSIGNYFLAAAQGFFRSLPSAIFLFSSITNSQADILPVIVTNHTVTIAAELEDGERIVGQCEISHPVVKKIPIDISISDAASPTEEYGQKKGKNVMFVTQDKDKYEALPSRIARILYLNAYGIEIYPAPNPDYLSRLATRNILVYSCGSLWTSIIPCLALRGVAMGIARSGSLRAKILLLNPKNDRETDGYTAIDYINSIAQTLNSSYHTHSYGLGNASTTYPVSAFITDLVYLKGTSVYVDVQQIMSLGVRCTEVETKQDQLLGNRENTLRFDPETVKQAIADIIHAQDPL